MVRFSLSIEQQKHFKIKRKLGGAVDESSADQEVRKSNATELNLRKICRPAPSRT